MDDSEEYFDSSADYILKDSLLESLPSEIIIKIFLYLSQQDRLSLSRQSRHLRNLYHSAVLWSCLDVAEFHRLPSPVLANVIKRVGPYIRQLNARGCSWLDTIWDCSQIVRHCTNLSDLDLAGCYSFDSTALNSLIARNQGLKSLDLQGLASPTNNTCYTIAMHCPDLEMLNISQCRQINSAGLVLIVRFCCKLKELHLMGCLGMDNQDLMCAIYNNLEDLHILNLRNCVDLTDDALNSFLNGKIYPSVYSGNQPLMKLKSLNIGHCIKITDASIRCLSWACPNLEFLSLAGLPKITDASLTRVIPLLSKLRFLDLEECDNLSDKAIMALVNNSCQSHAIENSLKELRVSCCHHITSSSVVGLIRSDHQLEVIELDNTDVSDVVLYEAARAISQRTNNIPLRLTVYDCPLISHRGIIEILSQNSLQLSKTKENIHRRIVYLKAYHKWQKLIDEHTNYVLSNDIENALKIESMWEVERANHTNNLLYESIDSQFYASSGMLQLRRFRLFKRCTIM